LLAILLFGLAVLGLSYYSLSSQFSTLEEKYTRAVKIKDSLIKNSEEDKMSLHRSEKEISQVRVDLGIKEEELRSCRRIALQKKASASSDDAKRMEEIQNKDLIIADARVKIQSLEKNIDDLRAENSRLSVLHTGSEKPGNSSLDGYHKADENDEKAVAPPPDAGQPVVPELNASAAKAEDPNVNAKNSLEAPGKQEIDLAQTPKSIPELNKEANIPLPGGDDSLFDAAGAPNDQEERPVDDINQDRAGNSLNDN